ncbi:Cullin-domain-containing protein [Piedraia hortae CBS 480.64]|uniref:Cullin-domain-containing protein n=1 Tax=Piedraia hortae CBS 480.64 TaxID=1314780 RepID=A0A6A7BUD6_9PEZI|nr:Cullin-domain-containing protein [Piedraia hortae CBS 480.64]
MSALHRGKTKFRPPKRSPNISNFDFEASWRILEQAFREIHTKNASDLSFEELYRVAYNAVLAKLGARLYDRVVDFEAAWLREHVRGQIAAKLTPPLMVDGHQGRPMITDGERLHAGASFLKALKQAWEDNYTCATMMSDVLMYLDRAYCPADRRASPFFRSMCLFRDQILHSPARPDFPTILDILIRVVLDQIEMDRSGQPMDQYLVRSNILMLEALYESDDKKDDERLYTKHLEPAFLRETSAFYRAEGERLLQECDAGSYCRKVHDRIRQEIVRCQTTLSPTSTGSIQRVVEEEMIRHQIKGVIQMDTGAAAMVEEQRHDELRLLFELEARVDKARPELTKAMWKCIAERGAAIQANVTAVAQAPPTTTEDRESGKAKATAARASNQQALAALAWVDEMLKLKDRFDAICQISFASDQGMTGSVNRSIADAINDFPRAAEYISLFIDDNMKKGIKDKTESEVDETLEKAIILLRYLNDKDVFETYYKRNLCKRLLLKKSISIEVEKQMISRIKLELGHSFTLKMETMFKDLALSEELTNSHKAWLVANNKDHRKRPDLSVKVLTSMTWPLEAFRTTDSEGNQRPTLIFPPAVEQLRTDFTSFYDSRHSGRKLTWIGIMGDADIRAHFPKSRHPVHEINCSTHSMLILLLFNKIPQGEWLTFEDIQARTNIPANDLMRNLQSLAVAPKTRFLVKEPMSREVRPGDQFKYNENFTSKLMRIKVGVVSAGNKVESDKERQETERKNNDSRAFAIEAAIVRIMKQRKECSHTQLITEIIGQLTRQFKPDPPMIKKRIEGLIEREYLERMDGSYYKYLA